MAPHGPTLQREFVTIFFLQGRRESVSVSQVRLIFGFMLFAFLCLGLRVWQEMQVVKVGYDLVHLRQQQQRITDEQRVLVSRRNALAGLDRIEAIARHQLGLTAPQERQVVFLPETVNARVGAWFGQPWQTWFGSWWSQWGASRL